MQQPKRPSISINDQKLMKQWAKDHGKCLRQHTVHQETLKFKAGTLPLNMYESTKQIGERPLFTTKPVNECESEEVNTGLVSQKAARKETNLDSESESESESESGSEEEVQALEYDSDSSYLSDSEEFAEECEEGSIASHVHNKELGFFFSKYRTRSGHSVRTSSKVLLWM